MSDDNGIGVGGLLIVGLFLLFMGLKLGNVIDWSWWWVFAPLWVPVAIVILIVLGLVGFFFIKEAIR